MSPWSAAQLSIAPLGAGDLIDRAVRLYRRHLFVLIRTAAPPVIIVAAGWILFGISMRSVFVTPETGDLMLYSFLALLSAAVMLGGYLFMLVVMGGATRTLVAHLLRNEPVTARATYSAVKARFWGLVGASLIVMTWIMAASAAAFMAVYIVLIVFVIGTVLFATVAPWLSTVIILMGALISIVLGLWIFFLIAAGFAYVPQVMLVEGKGVFAAVGRSFSLARGNVRRLMAMTLFTTFATYSALMILAVPLSWYGYLNGIDPGPWASEKWPAWYAIAYSVLGPLSSIVL